MHTYLAYTEAYIHIHTDTPDTQTRRLWLSQRRELTARDHVCLIVALDLKLLLSWLNNYWHKGKNLKHSSCSCTACCAAPTCIRLILWQRARHAHIPGICKGVHTHTHRSTVCGCHKGESSQRGCCCPRLPQVLSLEGLVRCNSTAAAAADQENTL